MNKLLLYCYYYLLWQPDSVLFNEKETHILKKNKTKQQQQQQQQQKKQKNKQKIGHAVSGAAIRASSLHPAPPPPGGNLRNF